jgi:hypothetical protein
MPAGVSAYTALANVTLGSSASTITFSSISGSYRDLILIGQGFSSTASGINIRYNGDSGSNYNQIVMFGDGGSASSSSSSSQTSYQVGRFDSSTLADFQANIMDYSATDKHKTTLHRYNSAAVLTAARAGRWASTSAITSFVLSLDSGTFNSGSTFALYGVSA